MHYGIIGMTESGKSTLGKIIAKGFSAKGIGVMVLDPLKYSDWKAEYITSENEPFLHKAKTCKRKLLVIDEGGQSIGRYNQAMEWVTTASRHWEHSCICLMQGVTQLTPIIRGQFSKIFLFNCSFQNWKIIADEKNHPELLKLPKLAKGECYVISGFEPIQKIRVDFAHRRLYYVKVS